MFRPLFIPRWTRPRASLTYWVVLLLNTKWYVIQATGARGFRTMTRTKDSPYPHLHHPSHTASPWTLPLQQPLAHLVPGMVASTIFATTGLAQWRIPMVQSKTCYLPGQSIINILRKNTTTMVSVTISDIPQCFLQKGWRGFLQELWWRHRRHLWFSASGSFE